MNLKTMMNILNFYLVNFQRDNKKNVWDLFMYITKDLNKCLQRLKIIIKKIKILIHNSTLWINNNNKVRDKDQSKESKIKIKGNLNS